MPTVVTHADYPLPPTAADAAALPLIAEPVTSRGTPLPHGKQGGKVAVHRIGKALALHDQELGTLLAQVATLANQISTLIGGQAPELLNTIVEIAARISTDGDALSALVAQMTALQAALAAHSHTKAQVGLGNVDNTRDNDKPISQAAAAEFARVIGILAQKADGAHSHTKAQIGLGNVDNTRDVDKPLSAAAIAQLDHLRLAIDETNRVLGIVNSGFAGVVTDVRVVASGTTRTLQKQIGGAWITFGTYAEAATESTGGTGDWNYGSNTGTA